MQTTNVNVVDLQIDDKYLQTLFDIKAEKMRNLTIKIENETKLKFYGLYKVATVGPVSDKDKNSVGYFDFTEKYKIQAWEKCSKLSKKEAMREYIKLYNKITGEIDEEEINPNPEENDFDINFGDLEIPHDIDSSTFVSTNAKESLKEISDYLQSASESEKLFHNLKDKIYNGDIIRTDYLKDYTEKNSFDLINAKDSTNQTILHVAVDAINNSAVQAIIDMGIAEKLVNSLDSFSMTPMHLASISFDYEIFSSLINLKPDLGIKDHEGKTAFDHLKENEEIESELIDALSKVNLK